MFFAYDFPFPLIIVSINGRNGIVATFAGFCFIPTEFDQLRVGENPKDVESFVPGGGGVFVLEESGDVFSGCFTLHDSEVNDGECTGDVAHAKDVRLAGLAKFVDLKARQVGVESGIFEAETMEVGLATGSHDELVAR